jgi:hypothetical protein
VQIFLTDLPEFPFHVSRAQGKAMLAAGVAKEFIPVIKTQRGSAWTTNTTAAYKIPFITFACDKCHLDIRFSGAKALDPVARHCGTQERAPEDVLSRFKQHYRLAATNPEQLTQARENLEAVTVQTIDLAKFF